MLIENDPQSLLVIVQTFVSLFLSRFEASKSVNIDEKAIQQCLTLIKNVSCDKSALEKLGDMFETTISPLTISYPKLGKYQCEVLEILTSAIQNKPTLNPDYIDFLNLTLQKDLLIPSSRSIKVSEPIFFFAIFEKGKDNFRKRPEVLKLVSLEL